MLNVTYYTEAKKAQAEKDTVFFAAVGSVIRSKKTGKLWYVSGFGIKLRITSREHGKLYVAILHVTCQDGTVTDMFNELMADNFEVVDLNATQCDRKTFKGLRNLIGLHCAIDGVLANKAHKCYRLNVIENNLFTCLLNTKADGRLYFCNPYERDALPINRVNRTITIFGRVTPLFHFKGKKA